VIVRYFVQIIIPRSICGLHVESRTLKLKARVHTLFSTNLIEICWRYLKMAVHYFV
jgi:hypothetical protein